MTLLQYYSQPTSFKLCIEHYSKLKGGVRHIPKCLYIDIEYVINK